MEYEFKVGQKYMYTLGGNIHENPELSEKND